MSKEKERIIIEIDEEDGIITNVWSTNPNISVNVLHQVPVYADDYEDWEEDIKSLKEEIADKGMVDIYMVNNTETRTVEREGGNYGRQ